MRDEQLDIYRGLTMIWILCILHVSCYFALFTNYIIDLIMFEMPVLFFISGAALTYTKDKPFKIQLKNRFKRIYLPFIIFCCLAIFVFGILRLFNLHTYQLKNFGFYPPSWLRSKPIHFLLTPPSYLWFIPQYFLIAISFPLQKKLIINKLGGVKYFILIVAVSIVIYALHIPYHYINFLSMTFCYNCFFIAGYVFYRKLSNKLITGLFLILAVIFTVLSIYKYDPFSLGSLMYGYKWQGHPYYLVFGFMCICLFAILLINVKIKKTKLIGLWSDLSFTIFLYQGFVFFVIGKLVYHWIDPATLPVPQRIVAFLILSVIVLFLSTVTSKLFIKTEETIISVATRLFSKIKICKKHPLIENNGNKES